MALEDNLTFYHTFASLTPDYPTSGLTESNPSGKTDPSVSAGEATFGTGSGGKGVSWAWSGGNFLTGGTSDFTVAIRFKITTEFSNGVWMATVGDGGRYLSVGVKSTVNDNLRAYVAGIAAETYTTNTAYVVGTYFVLVIRRASNVVTTWVNGANATASDGITSTSLTATPYNDISLGALPDGSDDADGVMDWFCVWDRALLDAEITTNMNETDISTALGLGGGGLAIPIDVGTTTLTTYDLTVSQQSGSVSIPIDVGSIVSASNAPTLSFDENKEVFPDQGELTLTTYVESLSFGYGIPTSVDPAEMFPNDSALSVSGSSPTVNIRYALPMSVGAVTITGYDLEVSASTGTFIDVDAGAITTTGYAPDDINAHVPNPTTGTVTFTGYAPTVDVTHVRDIGVGAVTATTYDLSVSADTNTAILMDVGAGTFTGSAPSLSFGIGRHPGAGSITFTSYTPDAISEDVSWEFFPDEGSATYSTYDLTLSIIEVHKSIPIAVGSLVIPGWKLPFGTEPSVEVGARKRRKILGFLK